MIPSWLIAVIGQMMKLMNVLLKVNYRIVSLYVFYPYYEPDTV
jgi:hypothetical protein